jgi:predicted nucleic acid-binding protein
VAVVGGAFFDTSVLLPGLIVAATTASPPRLLLRAIIAGELPEPLTAWHCCLEFYAVATRLPGELQLAPAAALRLIEEEILGRFRVEQLPAGARSQLLAGAARDGLGGGRIYDVHIAEIARSAGSRLVISDNRRHFLSLLGHGIRVLTAEEASRELLPAPDA